MERYTEERAALETKYSDLRKPLYKERGSVVSPDVWIKISRGFIRREGGRRRERGQRETTMLGRDRRGRGPHPWRTPPTTAISTAPSPPDRLLLILTPKTMPRTTITKRGAWWEYLSSGYTQWDTWRL